MRPHSAITSGKVEGPLEIAHVALAHLSQMLNGFWRATVEPQKIPVIFLNISQDVSVNAGVRQVDEGFVVSVSMGLVHRIWNLTTAYYFLGQPGIPKGHAISLLEEMKNVQELGFDFDNSTGAMETEGFFFTVPEGGQEFHSWVFERAIQFCVLHEVSHVIGDHFRSGWTIYDSRPASNLSNRSRQGTDNLSATPIPVYLEYMLELDADCLATDIMIKSSIWDDIWLRRIMKKTGSWDTVDIPLRQRLKAAMKLISTSQCIVLSSLYSDRMICGTTTKKHPKEIIRLCNFQCTYYSYAIDAVMKLEHVDAALNEIHYFMKCTQRSDGLFPSIYESYFDDSVLNKYMRYVARRRAQVDLVGNHPMSTIFESDGRVSNQMLRRVNWPDVPERGSQDRKAHEEYLVRFLTLLIEDDGTSKYIRQK